MQITSRIRLLVFPRDDQTFAARLAKIAAEVNDLARVGPDYLQQRLRASYTDAVVRSQTALGMLQGGPVVWYVYRDGSPRLASRWV